MTNLIPDSVRKLLSQYTFEDDSNNTSEDLSCTICGKFVLDAYQTCCECKYCRGCIITYMDNGNTHCRGVKDECREEKLLFDVNVNKCAMLDKKILRIRVRCPNKPCEFSATLTDMDDHLRVCSQQPTRCPYTTIGCQIGGGSRDTVETHIHRESLMHAELLMEAIDNLRNEVGGLKYDLRVSELEMKETSRLNEIETREILARVEEGRKSQQGEKEELIGRIEEQKTEITELREEIMEGAKIAASVAREDRKKIDELMVLIDSLNIGKDKEGAVGELWFSVDRISEKMGDYGKFIESPHLYSHANGYKLRIRVYPGGYHIFRGYLDVSSSVCVGEYDDLLPWPCRFTLSVAIVDRRTKQPLKTQIIKYDSSTDSRYSEKPVNTDDPQCGWLPLASHFDIRSFTCDDSLLFHVVVAT